MRPKVLELSFIVSIAVGLGLTAIGALSLPTKYAAFCFFLLCILILGLFIHKPRKYILSLLILSIQVQATKAFGRIHHFEGAEGLEIQISDVALALLLIICIWDFCIQKRKINLLPMTTIPAILFIFGATMSLFNSPYLNLSLFELIRIGKYFLMYLCLANVLRSKEDLRWCVTAFVASILIQGSIGLSQIIYGGSLGLGILGEPDMQVEAATMSSAMIQRALGTLGGPNAYGMYLGAIIPIALAFLFINKKPIEKSFCVTALIAGGAGLLLSLCRSQWIILPIVIAFLFRLLAKKNILKKVAHMGFVFLVIIAVAIVALFGTLIFTRLTSDIEAGIARIPLTRAALRAIVAHPLIGMGINTYSLEIWKYDPTKDHDIRGDDPPRAARRTMNIFEPVHNIYLLYAAEIGLIGVALFIWLIFATYKSLNYTIRNNNLFCSTIAIGVMASFSSLLLHSLVDFCIINNALFTLFWILISIAASLYRSSKEKCKMLPQ